MELENTFELNGILFLSHLYVQTREGLHTDCLKYATTTSSLLTVENWKLPYLQRLHLRK